MKRVLIPLALLTCAATAFAYTMNIRSGSVQYQGRTLGGSVEYRVNGQVVGWAKQMGSQTVYTDARNNRVGSVSKVGNRWQFRAGNNAMIGSVEQLGKDHVYRGANNAIIGYAKQLGGHTSYRAGNNAEIGRADTGAMPFRPIPLERHLAQAVKAAAPAGNLCLTLITEVKPDSVAARAGMQAGDILIGFEGVDWTIFNAVSPDHASMHAKVQEKVKATSQTEGIVYVVYRPAPNEKGQAAGSIVRLRPMAAGLKGFRYRTAAEGPTWNAGNSKGYVVQIRRIYEAAR